MLYFSLLLRTNIFIARLFIRFLSSCGKASINYYLVISLKYNFIFILTFSIKLSYKVSKKATIIVSF
jgi:hypothetical protein